MAKKMNTYCKTLKSEQNFGKVYKRLLEITRSKRLAAMESNPCSNGDESTISKESSNERLDNNQ